MFLDLVWLIYRANSKTAEQTSSYVVNELKQNCIEVVTTTSNHSNNSLLDLLESTNKVPDLAIVLGGDGTVLPKKKNCATIQLILGYASFVEIVLNIARPTVFP